MTWENPTGEKNGGTRGKPCEKLHPAAPLQPGETVTLCDIDGPGMITHIWMGSYVGHSYILRIYWDNEEYPSVEVPLSAFFGQAYDENVADVNGHYAVLNSALLLVAPHRGCNCYFQMPFRKHCRITLQNRSDKLRNNVFELTGWLGNIPDDCGYFHAAYSQAHPVTKGVPFKVLDYVVGNGRFLGIAFASGRNGNNTCWVEGEVKMYLDGDTYPSINYTAIEDYFCGSYAFGNDGISIYGDKCLHSYQTYHGIYTGLAAVFGNDHGLYNGQERFLMYRFHLPDPIYFKNDFTMTIDSLGWTGPRYDDFTSVGYYYLDKPSRLTAELPEDKEMIMK